MKNLTETELREKLQNIESKLASRTTEFVGEIGNFQYFIKQGIAKQLHSMTTNVHEENKLTLKEVEKIMFNISMLEEIFTLIGKREYVEHHLYKDMQEHL